MCPYSLQFRLSLVKQGDGGVMVTKKKSYKENARGKSDANWKPKIKNYAEGILL